MAIGDTTRIKLAPSARIFVRAPGTIQFGADATRTGLITVPDAEAVAAALAALSKSRLLKNAVASLPLDDDTSHSLIHDLLSYRVLVPVTSPGVLVLGRGALASQIGALLSARGASVRAQLKDESATKFLLDHDPAVPVVAVDCAEDAEHIAAVTRGRAGAVVPVQHFDSRVVVGPVCAGGGPCPVCAWLYVLERDPNFDHVLESLPPAESVEPVVVAAAAAMAATVVGRLAGLPDPPGVSAPAPVAGDVVVVDPYSPAPVALMRVTPHPDCPMCF